MTPAEIAALPEKVLFEHYTCDDGDGQPHRCRRRAVVYMDGVAYCADHADRITPSLLAFAKRIRYEVAR